MLDAATNQAEEEPEAAVQGRSRFPHSFSACTMAMDEPTALLCASLFLCYMYWWVALSIMRSAQFNANKASAQAHSIQTGTAGAAAVGAAASDYVTDKKVGEEYAARLC
jgi:hypothetical protein